ncbi:MAG: amidohydrolase family protein [Methanobacteriota archaeon]|nr:MAG: amidohydrolase family protein [Euryarchaeota archaeon]
MNLTQGFSCPWNTAKEFKKGIYDGMMRQITNVNIIDIKSGKIMENQSVGFTNRIWWIGEQNEHKVDETIDGAGSYLLPGLIDLHVHLQATTAVNWAEEMMRKKSGMDHYIALSNAHRHLRAGFTTLRDCGGELWGSSLRHSIDRGIVMGPRLLVAQWTIGQWGNQEAMGPDEWLEIQRKREVFTGSDGVRHAVRERKRLGSDFIKTMTTGGVLHGMESKLERTLWTEEELTAMVNEAHRLGMHVAVHAHGTAGIVHAARAGVDTIEHCSLVDEEGIKLMKKQGITMIPTQTSAFMDKPDLMEKLPPEVRKKTIEVDTAMIERHRIAFEAGVKIACGTDAGVPGNPHGTSARELELYVENIGMTPLQALQTATINAAEAIGLENVGRIEKDAFADLVLVKKNPLEDISVLSDLSNIIGVFKDGALVAKQGKIIPS